VQPPLAFLRMKRGMHPPNVISGCISFDYVSNIDYILGVKSSEFKRWLAAQGATFESAKGSHLKVILNGKTSFLPMHSKELKKGLAEGIKKQLGLK
jgi:mRNA interferase HicA